MLQSIVNIVKADDTSGLRRASQLSQPFEPKLRIAWTLSETGAKFLFGAWQTNSMVLIWWEQPDRSGKIGTAASPVRLSAAYGPSVISDDSGVCLQLLQKPGLL